MEVKKFKYPLNKVIDCKDKEGEDYGCKGES